MQWVSVGASRIYFYRNEELIQLTKDHNYLTQLQYRMEKGEITADEFESEKSKGEVLVSFMGVGGLSMIDCNAIPLALASGDEILMTTDGLYRLLDDSEICNILLNFKNINEALQALESKARRAAKHKNMSRDNMTVTLIKIK